jgi:hypothetical protein
MTTVILTYAAYILISLCLTVWVAKTLHKNGRLFLIDAFHGDEDRADAVNHLLVVGFYLINIGFILLFLARGEKPTEVVGAIEYSATKLGVVTLVLGAMHFFNMFNFDKMRRKGNRHTPPPLPRT